MNNGSPHSKSLLELVIMPLTLLIITAVVSYFVEKGQTRLTIDISNAELKSAELISNSHIRLEEKRAKMQIELKALELFSELIVSDDERSRELGAEFLRFVSLEHRKTLSPMVMASEPLGSRVRKKVEQLPISKKNEMVKISASQFVDGFNVIANAEGLVQNGPPFNSRPNFVEYKFFANHSGSFKLSIKYAAGESRPVDIKLNNLKLFNSVLGGKTGGWSKADCKESAVGTIEAQKGENFIQIFRGNVFPHLCEVQLDPVFQEH